jgi:hypothetical protein
MLTRDIGLRLITSDWVSYLTGEVGPSPPLLFTGVSGKPATSFLKYVLEFTNTARHLEFSLLLISNSLSL